MSYFDNEQRNRLRMNAEQLIATALAEGYCGFSFDEIEAASLKRSLRSLGKLTQTDLTVRRGEDSRPNTYSAIFGIGPFPFHTDFAFKAEPPRLIALLQLYERDIQPLHLCIRLRESFS
jgi:hypothetical protein